ncbi:S1C family serine protease [Natronobacterium texcoconense]|uniref:Serine protease, S1-C subfamily, contains C-terminal PDZ domain n=1 Tax=Natronobacterium texcoconense TaxID=1095778 RepID=A0A1H1GHW2_NATTX|nr:trypsin-like peptidase domain-containing protein [Natronobacterium texcoconense]SDR12761.1 serine protease, S1-C subfamily, contains C-terminal PDZ domain [Natronobacterium texcoconense]
MALVGVEPRVTPAPNQRSRRELLRTATATAVGVGIVGSSVALDGDENDSDAGNETETNGGEEPYAGLYEDSIDDVVLVTVSGVDEETPGGFGSGFVVDETIVTNAHVVRDADEVELQFTDEQWRTGTVLGTDVHSDLAAIEVDDGDLPELVDGFSLADETPAIGQEVVALGNPLGLDASITQGIVSGVDRSLPSPTGFSIPAAIQTDAPVNPGNSGGPLVDLEGEVQGVVFAGIGQTIGFAISSQLANRVVPALVDDGEYQHAYVGVGVDPVGPHVAEANDLAEPRGVLVLEVTPNSPADGVLEPADGLATVEDAPGPVPVGGDVIVAIDGEEIPNQERLTSYLALETSPGETIEIEVVRDGNLETGELTLEERPDVDGPEADGPMP